MSRKSRPRTKTKTRDYLLMLRDKAGLTQKQVAMAMGVEPHVYNQIENGKGGALMNAKKLLALADLLIVKTESANTLNLSSKVYSSLCFL